MGKGKGGRRNFYSKSRGMRGRCSDPNCDSCKQRRHAKKCRGCVNISRQSIDATKTWPAWVMDIIGQLDGCIDMCSIGVAFGSGGKEGYWLNVWPNTKTIRRGASLRTMKVDVAAVKGLCPEGVFVREVDVLEDEDGTMSPTNIAGVTFVNPDEIGFLVVQFCARQPSLADDVVAASKNLWN